MRAKIQKNNLGRRLSLVVLIGMSILLTGCLFYSRENKQSKLEGVMQNIGSERLYDVSVCYSDDLYDNGSFPVGILGVQSKATSLDISIPPDSKIKITIRLKRDSKEVIVYNLDMGAEIYKKIQTGVHTLYFQINLDKDLVLFKCFDSPSHEIDSIHGELKNAIKGVRGKTVPYTY